MNEEESRLSEEAFTWLKGQKALLVEQFASEIKYVPDESPTTLFMAGSPGAGKTEVSKRLMEKFNEQPVRIDADEIRALCPGYNGSNAHVFQKAANKGVNILYDHILSKGLNTILDGTFAYGGAMDNVGRSLKKDRKVELFYVYQNPKQAWEFTKKREKIEHRRVSKEVFVSAFIKSRENVNETKKMYGDRIEINIMIKNFKKGLEKLHLNVENIDHYISHRYSADDLSVLLK